MSDDGIIRDQLLAILPKGVPPELVTAIEDATHETLKSHGLSAFEMSRDAAITHETGHAIVAAAEGQITQSVRIFSRPTPLGSAWGGWCDPEDGSKWTTGPNSTADSDLSRARIIIAGLAGEAICGLDKPGSSIDEVVVSQVLAHNAAVKLDKEDFAEELWNERVLGGAIAILRANEGPFEQLVEHLRRSEIVRGGKLRAVLAQVRRIAP